MTEQEKMISGMIYDASDDDLATMRKYAHKMCNRYNKLDEDDEKRAEILDSLRQFQFYRARLRACNNRRQRLFRT